MSDVRKLERADIPLLVELYKKIFPEKKITEEKINDILNQDTSQVWVVPHHDGSHVIGFLYVLSVKPEIEVMDIGVDPSCRRQGVAKRLFLTLMDYANSARVEIIHLEVKDGNEAAIELYRHFGFFEVGRRKKYYQDGTDALLFQKLTRLT